MGVQSLNKIIEWDDDLENTGGDNHNSSHSTLEYTRKNKTTTVTENTTNIDTNLMNWNLT